MLLRGPASLDRFKAANMKAVSFRLSLIVASTSLTSSASDSYDPLCNYISELYVEKTSEVDH